MKYILYNLFTSNSLNPLTSDSSNFIWLIPVAIVSLVLVVVLIILGKKRK